MLYVIKNKKGWLCRNIVFQSAAVARMYLENLIKEGEILNPITDYIITPLEIYEEYQDDLGIENN